MHRLYEHGFRVWFGLLLLGLSLGLAACLTDIVPSTERAERAADAEGPIVIGIVNSGGEFSIRRGVEMAVAELNARGGVLGREIKIILHDDHTDQSRGQRIAKKLARNPDVVAVIGHVDSDVAIPVSITYARAGIVFITPGATDPGLTNYGFSTTFRNIPSDEIAGRQIADFAFEQGFKDIAILYRREDAERRLAEVFHEQAVSLGIDIKTRRSYFADETDFRGLLAEVKDLDCDAIFLAGALPVAGELIKQTRSMGIDAPFIGGYGLDSPNLLQIAGKAAEGTFVPSPFNLRQPSKITRDFVKRFEENFGVVPTSWDAQGYDAVQVLAEAIEQSVSSVPIVVSTTLHYLEQWEGVIGSYTFRTDGDIRGKSIFFKEVRNGKFKFLDTGLEAEIDPLYVIEDITLRIPIDAPVTTLDPGLNTEMNGVEIIEQLFLGLTDFDPQTYAPAPELAEEWEMSPDGRTYRFAMREDVTWTDGAPVTAHDVVWAIRRNIHPDTKSPLASDLYLLRSARAIHSGELKDVSQIGVRAIDDFTVEFTLEHPAAYFPSVVGLSAFRPLPRHVIEQYGRRWIKPEYIQTNGSYHLVAWKKGMVLILRKNEHYYNAAEVSIPEVRYYIIPDPSVGLAMYQSDELDILGSSYLAFPADDLSRIKVHPVLSEQYSRQPKFCTAFYFFMTQFAPVDNPLVRKAISAAIDRPRIIDLVLRGDERPAATMVPPGMVGSAAPSTSIGIEFDPQQARAWLAEAGYPDGKGLPELNLICGTSPIGIKIARALQASLRYYLQIQINYYPRFDQKHAPHLFYAADCTSYPDANSVLGNFHPANPASRLNWDQSALAQEYARLLETARSTLDTEERAEAFARAEQILTEEDAFFAPVYFPTAHCLVKPRVKDWYHIAIGGQHIRDWSLER